MGSENIRLEKAGFVATITFDRPKALNALNSATLRELEAALAQVGADREVRAIVLTGAGEKAFVAGADIAEMANMTPSEALDFSGAGHRVFRAIESLPQPSIAAVNGFALGGGLELALACDLVYASEKARFGQPEVGLGVIPGFGGTQRLARLVGGQRAKELIFTGEMIDAATAKAIGLVLEILPQDQLVAHCQAVAAKIAAKGPLAISQAKRVVGWGAEGGLTAGNELERQGFSALFGSSDQREGMRAFLEKRPAVFKGA